MKFSLTSPVKIVVLGCGGTGGHAIPHIYRLLHTLDRPVSVLVADGDLVESKNLIRQNFISADIGRNKAQVLAERYATAFGMEVQYIPEFIEDEERLTQLVKPDTYQASPYSYQRAEGLVILVGCVDNNKSRQLCHKVFKKAKNLLYIDAGNSETNGQVIFGVKRSSRTYYKPIGDIYSDVLEDTDKFPTELSCAEAALSAPQSIVANIMAATVIVNYLYNLLIKGEITTKFVTFSTNNIHVRPVLSQKHKRKAV